MADPGDDPPTPSFEPPPDLLAATAGASPGSDPAPAEHAPEPEPPPEPEADPARHPADHANPDAETMRRVLEERARALARSTTEVDQGGESIALIELAVGAERYGVNIRDVQEIEVLGDVTPVPGTPPYWLGLVNLRGRMYPVLDLQRYLSLADGSGESSEPKVALIGSGDLRVGVKIDDVPGVREIRATDIGPPVSDAGGARPEVVQGVTPDMLSVLDLKALLADPALVVDDEPAQAAG